MYLQAYSYNKTRITTTRGNFSKVSNLLELPLPPSCQASSLLCDPSLSFLAWIPFQAQECKKSSKGRLSI